MRKPPILTWTDEEEEFIKENYGYLTDAKMAKELGRSVSAVRIKRSKLGVIRENFIYTLYKGEDILATGTVKEIAEELGVEKDTITHYMAPSYLKKRSKSKTGNYRVLVRS